MTRDRESQPKILDDGFCYGPGQRHLKKKRKRKRPEPEEPKPKREVPTHDPKLFEGCTDLVAKHGFPMNQEVRGLMVQAIFTIIKEAIENNRIKTLNSYLRLALQMNQQNVILARMGKDEEIAKLQAAAQANDNKIIAFFNNNFDTSRKLEMIERLEEQIHEQRPAEIAFGPLTSSGNVGEPENVHEASLGGLDAGCEIGMGEAP